MNNTIRPKEWWDKCEMTIEESDKITHFRPMWHVLERPVTMEVNHLGLD